MAANPKRNIETRQPDKFGLTVILVAITLVAFAALLLANYNRTHMVAESKTTLQAPLQAPANVPQAPDVPTVRGHAFSVGNGSTNSNSTSRTDNGAGS